MIFLPSLVQIPSSHRICESMVEVSYECIDASLLVSDLMVSEARLEELSAQRDKTGHSVSTFDGRNRKGSDFSESLPKEF